MALLVALSIINYSVECFASSSIRLPYATVSFYLRDLLRLWGPRDQPLSYPNIGWKQVSQRFQSRIMCNRSLAHFQRFKEPLTVHLAQKRLGALWPARAPAFRSPGVSPGSPGVGPEEVLVLRQLVNLVIVNICP